MNEKHLYIINVPKLFSALNNKREIHGLTGIDHPLIASKLGILFALKTNGYVNFKGDTVELNDSQLIALQEILDQHFNAEMTAEIRHLVIAEEQWSKAGASTHLSQSSSSSAATTQKTGFLNKIRGFFKNKTKLQQESHA